MKYLLANYHRTVSGRSGSNVYELPDSSFDRHLALIEILGIPVEVPGNCDFEGSDHRTHAIGFTFDDGNDSDVRNASKLAQRGWRGVFFVPTADLGQPQHMNENDVRNLAASGMVVASHSHAHVDLTSLAPNQLREQLVRSKCILEDLTGAAVVQLAFPGGRCNQAVVEASIEAGYRYLHGTVWGSNDWPVSDGIILKRNNVLAGSTDLEFEQLITLQNEHRRRVVHGVKNAVRAVLPTRAYHGLRAWLSRPGKHS